jgi:hypothetical protein
VRRGKHRTMKRIGWVSLGFSLAAVSMVLAREVRGRWMFAHRSPYDFYSHAGEEFEAFEAGVGV